MTGPPETVIVLVTGVAGSGKTTVGAALAERLGWDFVEGDALHPPASVAKMARGEALTDRDRDPWLATLAGEVDARLRDGPPAVIATSVLKQRYRDRLRVADPRVALVFLQTSPDLARRRVTARAGHFFGPDLVASQFAALEPPDPAHAIVLPASAPVAEIVRLARARLGPWAA